MHDHEERLCLKVLRLALIKVLQTVPRSWSETNSYFNYSPWLKRKRESISKNRLQQNHELGEYVYQMQRLLDLLPSRVAEMWLVLTPTGTDDFNMRYSLNQPCLLQSNRVILISGQGYVGWIRAHMPYFANASQPANAANFYAGKTAAEK